MSKNIVIVGGGYAGVLTAKKLIKNLKKEIKNNEVKITLIDRRPYHTLMTELHEAAFERTEFESIKIYHKKIFNTKKIDLVLDNVTNIDYDKKSVVCENNSYNYDYLVEATGAKPTFFGIDGAKENTFKMWSYEDTLACHHKVLEKFTQAEREPNLEKRKELLTFVVAGAGFTGVEVIGELHEWIDRTLIYNYPTIKMEDVSLYLVDGAPRIMGSFGDKASRKVQKRLDKIGIKTILDSFIDKVTQDAVFFGETSIKTNMVIWTSGITCDPIAAGGHKLERGNRIPVNGNLESIGQDNVFVLGDIMYYIPEGQENPVPQMVENCEHAAPIVGNNIAYKIKGDSKQKTYKPTFHGAMACVGGRYGVSELKLAGKTLVFSGFFAMVVKHMINLVYFFQAAGIGKVWAYIKDEFFNTKGRRSILGGNLSAKSPSIYAVPLRLFIGLYWMIQGVPKVVKILQGGWHQVCVKTGFLPTEFKEYGDFCRAVYPKGEVEFNAMNGIGQAIDGVGSASVDVATSASGVIDTTVVPIVRESNNIWDQFLNWLNDFFTGMAPTETPYGLGFDFQLIPVFITDLVVQFMNWNMSMIGGIEWLMEVVFAFAEAGLGFLLIIGLFIPFTSICLLILAVMISLGSYVSYGIVVEGLIFTIVGTLALIGIGSTDAQPLSVDHYLNPYLKKRKKRKSK